MLYAIFYSDPSFKNLGLVVQWIEKEGVEQTNLASPAPDVLIDGAETSASTELYSTSFPAAS